MAYTDLNVATPADSDAVSAGAGAIRSFKSQVKDFFDKALAGTITMGKAADADKLNGVASASAATASTVVARDSAGRSKFVAGAATGDAVVFDQFAATVTETGSMVLPNGLVYKWGRGNTGTAVTFATPFPTACFVVSLTPQSSGNVVSMRLTAAPTASGFDDTGWNHTGGLIFTGARHWIAIGN